MKTKTRIGAVLFFLIAIFLLSPFQLFAQWEKTPIPPTVLGSDDPGQLKIVIYNDQTDYIDGDGNKWFGANGAQNGQWQIFRGGKRQFYRPDEILSVRLKDNTDPYGRVLIFSPASKDKLYNDAIMHATNNYITREDFPGYNNGQHIGIINGQEQRLIHGLVFHQIDSTAVVTNGTEQQVTRIFHGHYYEYDFTVRWTVRYDSATPDIIRMSAEIDASNLPSYYEISLGYGFDANVNGNSYSAAYVLPDAGFDGLPDFYRVRLYHDRIQNARLIGAKNTSGTGAFFGYFPIGRPFDKGCATYHLYAHSYWVVAQDKNLFNFGPYAVPKQPIYNLGCAVAYDSIAPGQVTAINTGLTFSSYLAGDLQYSWNNNFENLNKTIPVVTGGANTDLYLQYNSHYEKAITDLKFQVNLPDHVKLNGNAESFGFSPFSGSASADSSAYAVTAGIGAYPATGTVKMPVHVSTYGRYVIAAHSISNTEQTTPLSGTAILTATSTVGYQNTAGVTISRGKSATYIVKLPDGVPANGDLTVNVSYQGDKNAFSSLPATVVIPDGENSALLVITASPSAADGANVTAILTSTDHALVTIDGNKEVRVTVTDQSVGKLDYSWDHSWAPVDSSLVLGNGGGNTNLYLRYNNDNADAITGLEFQLDLPKAITYNGPSEHKNFSSFTTSATAGSSSYDVTANINANTTGTITVPVHVGSYGPFVMDVGSFSHTVQTNPLSEPATLTVSTTVGFKTTADATVAQGQSITLTVKLPDGVHANGDLSIDIKYAGEIEAFSSLPVKVVIPAGLNSVSLVITALDTAPEGASVMATLDGTDNPFALVDNTTPQEVKVTVKAPKYLLPVNRITSYSK